MQRLLLVLYALSVAAAVLVTHSSTLTVTTAHHWSSLAMYVVVAPALAWLAIDHWIAGHSWFAALFGALAAERLHLLAQLAAPIGFADSGHSQISPNGLVPIVLFLSIVLFRLAFGRLLARLAQYAHAKATLRAPTG
jgi:hypothetical protein